MGIVWDRMAETVTQCDCQCKICSGSGHVYNYTKIGGGIGMESCNKCRGNGKSGRACLKDNCTRRYYMYGVPMESTPT